MRSKFKQSPDLFTVAISDAPFPTKLSRDEAPILLKGLQSIYLHDSLNPQVFELLNLSINDKTGKGEGRKGMGLWEIFVLSVMRNGLNINYDKLHYLANYDHLMRCVMGVASEDSRKETQEYSLTALKENVALLGIDTINKINDLVVAHGHRIVKKKDGTTLEIKADSFVVETNVHFPTDLNLLWDSVRKCIDVAQWFSVNRGISGWRKSASWKSEIKSSFRITSRAGKGGGKNKEERVQKAASNYLFICDKLAKKARILLAQTCQFFDTASYVKSMELSYYLEMLEKHLDLVNRRLLQEEKIPTCEKLYSIFESHTEWLSKGKSGKSVELGHNFLIATDQYHFIVHHKVIQGIKDVNLTLELGDDLLRKFPNQIRSLSLDKGFYSKENKEVLSAKIPKLILPKKGKRNKEEEEQEYEQEFVKLRHKHSAVESNINQLEHNGLNRCCDKTLKGFKRYASLSVLAYNMHRLGKYLTDQEKKKLKAAA